MPLLLLAGVATALALPPLGLTPILLLTVPTLLRRIDAARSTARALWCGFVFGFGFYCAGLYWITNAVLTRVDAFWWAVPLAAPLCAVPLAVFLAVPCAACRCAPAGWRRVLLLAGLWTLSDLAREFAFTGFPWNPLGSTWEWPGYISTVMLQPAAWIGVPGLTLATVLAAAGPALGRRGVAASLLLLALWAGAGAARLASLRPLPTRNPMVVLVQGNIPEREKFDRAAAVQTFRSYLRLTAQGVGRARSQPPGDTKGLVVVWPESAFPGLLVEDGPARQMIMQAASGASAALIGSVRFGQDGQPRNSLVALLPGGAIADVYDKAHLVPFGEYQPAILPIQIVPGGGFRAGPGRRTLRLPRLAAVDPLICYEIIFPGKVVKPGNRPSWIVNITNDAWYGDSSGPRQHLAAARMRAVEEGLPVARVANTGISAAYDAFGRERARLGWGLADSLVAALPPPLPPTLFARFGLLTPLLLALALSTLALVPLPFMLARHPRKASQV